MWRPVTCADCGRRRPPPAARLNALLAAAPDESRQARRAVAEIERQQGITYAPLQRQAVELAAKVGVRSC